VCLCTPGWATDDGLRRVELHVRAARLGDDGPKLPRRTRL